MDPGEDDVVGVVMEEIEVLLGPESAPQVKTGGPGIVYPERLV